MMHKRFSLGLVLSLGALSALSAGCEVSTCTGDDCDFGDGDGSLFDGDDFDGDEDGSDGNDDGSDGSELDAGTDGDAGDGDGSDGDPGALTVAEFCDAFHSKAVAWRNKLTECCLLSGDLAGERSAEAAEIFRIFEYEDDSYTACVEGYEGLIADRAVTFDGTRAQACADARNAAFADPPSACPTGEGFPIWQILGAIGHGLQDIAQIDACRDTFAGELTNGQACPTARSHLRCADNLVCRDAAGGGFTCQPPVTEGECRDSGQCVEGRVCVGASANESDGVCAPAEDLPTRGNCNSARECAEGYICAEAGCEPVPTGLGEAGSTECAEFSCNGYCSDPEGAAVCAPLCAAD